MRLLIIFYGFLRLTCQRTARTRRETAIWSFPFDSEQICGPRMQIPTESRYRTHVHAVRFHLAASSLAVSPRVEISPAGENWSAAACNFQAVNSSRPAVNALESVPLLWFVYSRVRVFARIHSTCRFCHRGRGRRGREGGVHVFSRSSALTRFREMDSRESFLEGVPLPFVILASPGLRPESGRICRDRADRFLSLPPSPEKARRSGNESLDYRLYKPAFVQIFFLHTFEFKFGKK